VKEPRGEDPSVLEPRLPASKSIAQRVLLMAACARGTTRIGPGPALVGDDVAAARALVERWSGRSIDAGVVGREAGPAEASFDVGESGTLLRFACAVLGLSGAAGPFRLRLAGTLRRRSSPALREALARVGGRVERRGDELVVHPAALPSSITLASPRSSQEVSALLLALARGPRASELRVEGVIPSRPYVDLTIVLLERFGVQVRCHAQDGGARYEVRGPLVAPRGELAIEPDASAAAVALAAGAITSRRVRIAGLGRASLQGDVAIARQLRAFGAACDDRADELSVRGGVRHGARIDCADTPDLAPVCAALGATVALRHASGPEGRTELTGLATLPDKESSRIAVLAAGLRRLGLAVVHDDRSLAIGPGGPEAASSPSVPIELAVHGDHRMAFAFALVGLARGGLRVDQPGVVAKSWPGFWEFASQVRARDAD